MSRRKRTVWLLAALSVLVVATVALVGVGFAAKQAVAATFKGGQVTVIELEKQFDLERKLVSPGFADNNTERAKFLQEYITLQRVMTAEAVQAGIKVNTAQLPQEVQDYKDQVTQLVYGGDADLFNNALKTYGITDADLTQLVENNDLLQQYKAKETQSITVTPTEVQTYYDQHKGQFATGTVSQILVRTEADAKAVQARLNKGENFAAVAKEVSIDPTVSLNNGTLTDANFAMFQPEFRQAAATLALGKISDPIQTQDGWQIIRVDKRTIPAFSAVQKEVQQQALEDKQDAAWNDFYQQTLQAADIHINLPTS